MAVSVQKDVLKNLAMVECPGDFLKNLECPVCLDVYTDPRLLPCPEGGHTLCKKCMDGMVKGSTITCPECRVKHDVPPSGTDGFPPNIMAAGMTDSLCGECRMAHPEVTCSHCVKKLCRSCHVAHEAFDAVKQSVDKLHIVIQKGGKDVNKSEIKRLGVVIEHEIDQEMDQLADQLVDRRITLKAELRNMIKKQLDSLKPWRKEVDRKTSEAQTYLDTANRELGDEYSDQITSQQMAEITSQSQQKINEIESIISKVPPLPTPVLVYNSHPGATISSFGSIKLLPPDSRLIVAGKRGSGPALPRPTTQMAATAGQSGPKVSYKYTNNMRNPQPGMAHQQPAVDELTGSEKEGRELHVGRTQKNAERQAELKERFERLKHERMNRYQGVNLDVKNLDDGIDDERLRFRPRFLRKVTTSSASQKALTASMLAGAPQQEQKQILGERLFPLIQSMYPDMAGKITGMLLEIDNSELLHMLENGESLKAKVYEAVAVLKAHQAKEVASTQTGTKCNQTIQTYF